MAYQVTSEAPRSSVVYGGPGFLRAFGEAKAPVCPPLKFVCTPDCPFPSSSCKKRKDLCDRVLGAINLAKRAAALLETKPRSSVTVTEVPPGLRYAPRSPPASQARQRLVSLAGRPQAEMHGKVRRCLQARNSAVGVSGTSGSYPCGEVR